MNEQASNTIQAFLNDQIDYWEGYLKRHPKSSMKKDVKEGLRRFKNLL
jgi:hypothetical protein